MNIGDTVRHKLTDSKMQIRTLKGKVATCWQLDLPKEWVPFLQAEEWQISVCLIENLEPWIEEDQLKLF